MSTTVGVDPDATQVAIRGLRAGADSFDAQASCAPPQVDAGDATALLTGALAQVLNSGTQLDTRAATLAAMADDAVRELLSNDAEAHSRIDEITGELQQ